MIKACDIADGMTGGGGGAHQPSSMAFGLGSVRATKALHFEGAIACSRVNGIIKLCLHGKLTALFSVKKANKNMAIAMGKRRA